MQSRTRKDSIATLLHDYIVRTGETEDTLGELVGSNQSQVSRWRRGESVPREEWIEPLAEALGVSVSAVAAARVESERVRENRDKKKPSAEETTKTLRAEIRRRDAKIRRLEAQLKKRT